MINFLLFCFFGRQADPTGMPPSSRTAAEKRLRVRYYAKQAAKAAEAASES